MIGSLIFFLSCTESTTTLVNSCGVTLITEPTLVGNSEVTIQATPLSETWDTYVHINGEQVEVLSVQRLGCSPCDSCRVENFCDSCDECSECTALCDTNVCSEEITIQTPTLSEDQASLQIINKYGQSPVYELPVSSEEQ